MSHELPPYLDELETLADIPVPEWHLKIVEERLARYGDSTEGFMSLEDFLGTSNTLRAEDVGDV